MRLFCYYYSESPDYNFCLPNCGNYILYLNKIIIRHDINTVWYLYIHKFSVLRFLGIILTKLKGLIYFLHICSFNLNIPVPIYIIFSYENPRYLVWFSDSASGWRSKKAVIVVISRGEVQRRLHSNENRSRYQYMILSPGL